MSGIINYASSFKDSKTNVCGCVLQVYSAVWKEKAVVVKCGLHDAQRDASLYDKPTRGTSMDEFREMLHSFLKVLLSTSFFLLLRAAINLLCTCTTV